jgi:hypothetical protein
MLNSEKRALLRALRDVIAAKIAAVDQVLEELKSRVLSLEATPPPEVKVRNDVAVPTVHVNVDMKPLTQAMREMTKLLAEVGHARKPRRLKISHTDGTESIIAEE